MRKSRLPGYKDWHLSRGIGVIYIKWLLERKPPRKGSFLKLVKGDLTQPLALLLWVAGVSLVLGSLYRLIWLGGDPQRYIPLLLFGAYILYIMMSAFTTVLNRLKYGVVHYFVINNKDIENSEKLHGDLLYVTPSESDLKGFPAQKITVDLNAIRELKYTYQYTRIEILAVVHFKHGAVVDSRALAYRGLE